MWALYANDLGSPQLPPHGPLHMAFLALSLVCGGTAGQQWQEGPTHLQSVTSLGNMQNVLRRRRFDFCFCTGGICTAFWHTSQPPSRQIHFILFHRLACHNDLRNGLENDYFIPRTYWNVQGELYKRIGYPNAFSRCSEEVLTLMETRNRLLGSHV